MKTTRVIAVPGADQITNFCADFIPNFCADSIIKSSNSHKTTSKINHKIFEIPKLYFFFKISKISFQGFAT